MNRRPAFTGAVKRGLKLLVERDDLAWLMTREGAGLKGRQRRDVRRAHRYLQRLIAWKEDRSS